MKIEICFLLIVILVASPAFAQDESAASGSSSPAIQSNNDDVIIELTKSRRLTGELGNVSEVKLQTKFGEANIPLSEVDGIKLHTDENDNAVVAFKNGDVVTGELKMDSLAITTDWGNASVKLASVETILLNKSGSFYQDSTDGKQRWRFGDTREIANTTSRRQAQPQRQQPGVRPQRQNLQPNRFGG